MYGFNPLINERELMSQTEAISKGYKVMTPVTAKEVSDDVQMSNRLGDVHQKISRYEQSMQQPLLPYDQERLASVIGSGKLKLGLFGSEMPLDKANAWLKQQNLEGLSPAARDQLVNYYNAREAMTGYNRVLSGSGRSNEKNLELQLETLPDPSISDPDYSARAFSAFKENLNVVDQGMPRIPGIKRPADWETTQSAPPPSPRQQTYQAPPPAPPSNRAASPISLYGQGLSSGVKVSLKDLLGSVFGGR